MSNLEKAKEFNRLGNDLYARGEYDKAIAQYKEAVALDPTYVSAYYNLGLCYKNLEDPENTAFYFHKNLELDTDDTDALNTMGIHFYDHQEYDESERYYLKALEKNDRLYYVYYNLALIERERGNQEKRLEYLLHALKISPGYSLALNEIGNYYYDMSDYETAKGYYQKALRSDPNHKYACYNLGLVAEVNMEYELAKSYYEKALKIDPNYDRPKKGLEDINQKLTEEKNFDVKVKKTDTKEETEKEETYAEKIGRNLNELAKADKLDDVIGREKEIETIFEILFKRFKNNPILIGAPGVGKTAIVEGIAKMIVEEKVPDHFKNKEIIEVNVGMLIAGTKYRGEFETKIKKILEDAKKNENMILFIDEIHTIIGAGRVEDSNLDIAQMIKPALQRGEITCIGATTTNEYRKYIESDPALERRFYPVMIDELSPEATLDILLHISTKAQTYYKINYTEENINEIIELTGKYLRKRHFPDKAIDIFEKVSARVALHGKKEITPVDIRKIVGEAAGIDFVEDDLDEMRRLDTLEDELKKMVFGQDKVVESICNHLRITKRRLDLKPERPDGVFLFTGPTGVGKTFLAKSLCKCLYGDENKLIQMDMSEFSEPHSVSKIIGAPPGYIGFNESTALTTLILDNPTSVLLLDEIEKADINVIKLFLQVFDEGKITDSKGKKIYFSDVTVIMTSNILAREKSSIGFSDSTDDHRTDKVVEELSKFFPKEFLNRIDEIIVFNPLSENDIQSILFNNIVKQTKVRFTHEGISLTFEESLIKQVIKLGYSPQLGARNLERTFEKEVLSPLVKYVYKKNRSDIHLSVSFENGSVNITETR
jgi:ATP-dependent Clp protease ATP-binding subunit ClpA